MSGVRPPPSCGLKPEIDRLVEVDADGGGARRLDAANGRLQIAGGPLRRVAATA